MVHCMLQDPFDAMKSIVKTEPTVKCTMMAHFIANVLKDTKAITVNRRKARIVTLKVAHFDIKNEIVSQ